MSEKIAVILGELYLLIIDAPVTGLRTGVGARYELWDSNSVQPAEGPETWVELPVALVAPLQQQQQLPFESDQLATVLPLDGRGSGRTATRVSKKKRLADSRELSQPLSLVAEFHRAFALPMSQRPTASLPVDLAKLRVDLLLEEVGEFVDATERNDLIAIADALADIAYVTYGAAVTYGIDLDAVLAEVHRSNMSKLGPDGKPLLREDGKVLKSQRYSGPNIPAVLRDQLPLPF